MVVNFHAFFMAVGTFFQFAGVTMILVGGVYALGHYLVRAARGARLADFERLRLVLSQSLLGGLELIVAADVVSTVSEQDYARLGMLVILVIIRTVLNYFLKQDVRDLRIH